MSERAKRNEVAIEDRFVHTEFLVYGTFREDAEDGGFSTTRWLPADELAELDDFEDALDALDSLLQDTRETCLESRGGGASSESEG